MGPLPVTNTQPKKQRAERRLLSLIISLYWGPVGPGGRWSVAVGLKERGVAFKVFHHLLLNHVDSKTIVLYERRPAPILSSSHASKLIYVTIRCRSGEYLSWES